MKYTLIIALLLALCGIALSSDRSEELKKFAEACIEENKASKKNFQLLMAGKLKPADITDVMRCAMKCLLEKEGFIDPVTGVFLPDAMRDKLNEEKTDAELDKAIAACKDIKGVNSCDKAFKIIMCLWDYDVK